MLGALTMELRRKWALRGLSAGVFKDYLSESLPALELPLEEIEFMAIDLETSGLNAQTDDIVSVGIVIIRGMKIDMGSSMHFLVRPRGALDALSPTFHTITDDEAAKGETLKTAIEHILSMSKGRVLLAHNASVEFGFLNKACGTLYGQPYVSRIVDTMILERDRLSRGNQPIMDNALRLANVRNRYNLPRYKAHNAILDALACSELFLAQVSSIGKDLKLRDISSF